MDQQAVLTGFDTTIRRHPEVGMPGLSVERDDTVIRVAGGGWCGVAWSDLAAADADAPGPRKGCWSPRSPTSTSTCRRRTGSPCAGGSPVAGGRVDFHPGTEFASLWGGCTLPEWRGRGVFRALVTHRAALAAARGFRYLQLDGSPDSRPILRRLGFVELATTTPFTYPAGTFSAGARPGTG